MKNLKEIYMEIKDGNLQLKEEITRKELAPMLDSFVSFASDKLGLKSLPKIKYKGKEDDYNSFAAYSPSTNELSISTLNRHPMDIFRSVAHELVHHKQNEDGKLGKDVEKEGSTGSDIENEANSEAGKIMRWFAKANPSMFSKSYVVESTNSTAMGGAIRGLGNVTGDVSPTITSQYVLDNQAYTQKLQTNSTEGLWYDDGIKSYWLDKKGISDYKIKTSKVAKVSKQNLTEGIYDPGKLKAIFLAGGPGSGKDFVMNKVLAGNGLREVNSDTAFEFLMKKAGLDLEMPDEERLERDIVRGRAKSITKEKERLALAGRLGLIINGTADDLEKIKTVKSQLEADGYETMMVFVNTSNEVSRERNVERGKRGNRKVPDGTDKNGVPDSSPDIRQEKWDAAQKNIGELQKIFGNQSFAVIDNSADIRKVSSEEKEKIETSFNRVRRMVGTFVQSENRNPKADQWKNREAEKRGISYIPSKSYKETKQKTSVLMPNVIHKPQNDEMEQARRLGLSYYGFGRFGRKIGGKNKVTHISKGGKLQRVQTMTEQKKNINESFEDFMKIPANREVGKNTTTFIYKTMTPGQEPGAEAPDARKRKKLAQEDAGLPKGAWDLASMNDGLGPSFSLRASPALVTGFANIGSTLAEASESIREWALKENTQRKFFEKYGNDAVNKLLEACLTLEKAGCGCDHSKPKSIKKLRESFDKGIMDIKPIGTGMYRPHMEVDEDWQKVNRKDKTDGMSRKAVKAYRRENPGSKLSTAVTEKNPTGKRADRKASFCRRMTGMKRKLTSAKTARDPDSNINRALDRWNCKE